MLIDTTKEAPPSLLRVDVCVVGSGPAGITLARTICRSGLRVCLLESGGNKASKAAENLNTGIVDSPHGYREQTFREGRCRQFGGSANLWNHELRGAPGGHIRYLPLDKIDFERQDWIPESGWPFSRQEIQSYYEIAQRVCGIGKFDYRATAWDNGAKSRQPWRTEKLESIISQFGSPSIFKERFCRELASAERVSVFLRAVLLELGMDPVSRAITSACAGTPDGGKFQVEAKVFVLAAGGLENARILLLQDKIQSGGLGNQNDMVGRCFMDHPSITLGTLVPFSGAIFNQAGFYDQHDVEGQAVMGLLRIRPDVMRREKILNVCAVLAPHFKNLWASKLAFVRQLLDKGPRFIARRHLRFDQYDLGAFVAPSRPLRQRLLNEYYSESQCGWSRLSGPDRCFGEFGVLSLVEQSPDRSNRIILGAEADIFGQRKIKLVWRWNELDLHSIRAAQEIFRNDLAAAGIGTFIPTEETDSRSRPFNSPHHFMGTTRMGNNPKNSVVDADCRIHDVPNLFIAGSSVFPTGGFANPTLTIIALTLRLANCIQSELQSVPEIQVPSKSEKRSD
jgi:choline dehydrogenase-like flavoprotein